MSLGQSSLFNFMTNATTVIKRIVRLDKFPEVELTQTTGDNGVVKWLITQYAAQWYQSSDVPRSMSYQCAPFFWSKSFSSMMYQANSSTTSFISLSEDGVVQDNPDAILIPFWSERGGRNILL